ncbi:hypothetical protein [Amycolatopsis magusensis]|uniref:hypothetical protein n=1 Tax=Amycolatopsis magusensis TaxID=882444 RepID=UPI0037B58826
MTAALLGAALAGCGDDSMRSGDSDQPTITEPQALEQAERYVRDLVTALPASARLEEQGKLSSRCPDESGTGFDKRVRANANYWVRDLDPAQYNAYFDAVKTWLESHGWVVRNDDRPADMFLNAYREQDDFIMSLQANNKGGLVLGAASPCVWPGGTPESQ